MHKLLSVVLFALVACGGEDDSRSSECEVDGCDQALIDTCVAAVDTCETAGGPLEGTCIDTAIAANDIACGAGA